MRKCDNYLCCSGYKYAPEQFKAYKVVGFSNGNKNVPMYEQIQLTPDETSTCGYELVTKGKAAAIAKLKTILRKREQNKKRYINYGFRMVDDEKQFAYIPGRGIPANANMESKLHAYKTVKANMEYLKWEIVRMIETKLGAGYSIESQNEVKEKVNPNAPMIFYS